MVQAESPIEFTDRDKLAEDCFDYWFISQCYRRRYQGDQDLVPHTGLAVRCLKAMSMTTENELLRTLAEKLNHNLIYGE